MGVLQGEIYLVRCPYCGKITEALRLTPFATKLKCLDCYSWVEEELIVFQEEAV